MKKIIITLSAVFFMIAIVFTSCKKDEYLQVPLTGFDVTSINTKILRIVENPQGGVNLFVSVTDQKDRPIENLSVKDFYMEMIDANGVITPIKAIGPLSLPSLIITALTMDYSGSMYTDTIAVPSMENAISSFITMKNPYDQCEILKFSTTVQTTVPLTSNPQLLFAGLADTTFAGHGSTALYRAIIQGMNDVNTLASNNPTYLPSVIGFTDGKNNQTPLTLDSLLLTSITKQIPVFTVGYGVNPDTTSLKTIADSTGGSFFWSPNAAGLTQLFQTVNGQLTSSSIITVPGPPSKGKITYRVTATYKSPNGIYEDTDQKYFYY